MAQKGILELRVLKALKGTWAPRDHMAQRGHAEFKVHRDQKEIQALPEQLVLLVQRALAGLQELKEIPATRAIKAT